MSRRCLSKSRRCNVVTSQRCNVATSQRHNIGSSTPWNVATLHLNIATSVLPFSRTSRRWIYSFSGTSRRWIPTSRRWIYSFFATSGRWIPTSRRWFYTLSGTSRRWQLHPWECRDVKPERRDVALFIDQKLSIFLSYPHTPLSESSHTPSRTHCCNLRPPSCLYHHQSSPTHATPPPLSRASITRKWCPNSTPVGSQ